MLAQEYPITQIGEVLEVARSTYYHRRAQLDELEVRQAIAAVAGEWPRSGYRRITKQLQRQGWSVNHKRVERIMRELGRSLDQSLTLRALEQALGHHTPEIHHSDQGVQYAATAYTARLQAAGVQISMAEVGAAWQNGYAERLMRTIKEEEVDLSDYANYADAVRQIGRFLDEVYMHKRIHSSLGYLTPAGFESQWREQQGRQTSIH
jgi:transposase InsO family protein